MTFLKFEYNGKTFVIDMLLAYSLNSLIYNIKKDWDFVILVTGNRMVRVGKSVMAMTICSYLSQVLKRRKLNDNGFNVNNIFFEHQVLMKEAQKREYSVLQYDEGREALASSKAMTQIHKDLEDFFNECGQLNNIYVIVLPDLFDLKEYMAVGRSECLINVYRKEKGIELDFFNDGNKIPIVKFERGYFCFFNKVSKNLLFDKFRTTRRKTYFGVKPDFPPGRFVNQYPIEEEVYKKLKREALKRFNDRHKEKTKNVSDKYRKMVIEWIKDRKKPGLTWDSLAIEYTKTFKEQATAESLRNLIYRSKNDL